MEKRLNTLLSSIFLILVLQPANAQNKISGTVADSAGRNHLPFVTVRLVDNKQTLLKTSISDSAGNYFFENVAQGTYQLRFSITGYASKGSSFFTIKDSSLVLPVSYLTRSNETLAEVMVAAQRPLISAKIDGFIYNAAQDVQIAGENAADLLRKIPGVQVDQNGMPQMRGSNRIKVFIDGKPSATYANSVADALRQISSDNIKTVEVITHPSARYDAEGIDGVINILTKRSADNGWSGTVNGILANRFNELTAAITWRKQRLVVGADIGHSNSSNLTRSCLERSDYSTNNAGLLQQKETENEGHNVFGGINFIYLADSLTTVNAGYRYGGDRFGAETSRDNFTPSDTFMRSVNNPARRFLHGINAGWLHKSRDKSMEYNVMAYWFYQGQRSHYVLDQFRGQQKDYSEKNRNLLDNKEFSFQADITKKFRKGSELEAGVKGAFRKFSYDNLFDVYDFNQSDYLPDYIREDRFWFNWAIVAAYGSYTLDLKSWKIKGGLRYEHTHWPLHFKNSSPDIPDYRNLLPNLIVSKVISRNHNISIGYARKLLRPYINYLNPVVNYIDSLNLEYGNPNLKPAITNSYDFSYTFQKSPCLLNVTLFYNQTGNSIERVRIERPDGIIANTYANVADYEVFGVSISASLRLKRFNFSMTNTTRYLEFNSQNGFSYRNGFIINQSVDVSFKPTASWTIRAYANLNSRNFSLQGYITGVQSYTFSVNKELLNGKFNLSARFDNLFTPYRYITEITDAETFHQNTETRYINRYFRIALRWKWGKKEVTRPQVREIGGY
jgi:outer membrane receptor protein involved in Fe transport